MDTGAVVISPAGTCGENIERPKAAREEADQEQKEIASVNVLHVARANEPDSS